MHFVRTLLHLRLGLCFRTLLNIRFKPHNIVSKGLFSLVGTLVFLRKVMRFKHGNALLYGLFLLFVFYMTVLYVRNIITFIYI